MKKIYITLLFSVFGLFFSSAIFSQSNYITLGNLGTTSFCPSGTLAVPFTTDLPAGTVFRVYLSNSTGSFSSQTQIGSGTVSPISVTFPTSVSSGTGYLIRIVSVSPVVTSSLSTSLTTNGRVMTISVKNLVGKEINGGAICQGSALTGIISSNQSDVIYEWKKDGIIQNTNPDLRMIQSGNYIASVQKVGCNSNLTKSFNITFSSTVYHYISLQGEENQCIGSSVLLRDSYYSDSVNYQWKKDGINLIVAAKDTLFATQTGKYEVVITDKCHALDGIFNNFKKILFSNAIENKILSSNGKTALCGNTTYINLYSGKVNLTRNPYAPYSFQWKKNGTAISGATQSSINILNTTGLYNLVLSQGACTSISDAIAITKIDTVRLGLEIGEPYKSETCNGLSVLLNTSYLSGVSLSFYKDGVLFSPSQQNFFYATTTGKYTIGGTATNCVVLPSDTVKITISNKIKPSIFTLGNVLCSGNSTSLTAWNSLYSSLPNVSQQWYRNNVAIPNSNYSQMNYINQAGFYKVKVTADNCSGFSDSVEVKVVPQLPKPTILLSSNKTACNNALMQLDIKYRSPMEIGTEAIYDSLFWKKNGVIIDRKKRNAELLYTYIDQSGTYTVIGKQGTCLSEESDPVEIKIGEPITANITGTTSIYPGQKAKLNLNFTGGNAWSYQTSDVATGQTTSSSPTLKIVSPASTQTYSITSVASNCGVGTVTGNATVTVLPCPTTQAISLNNGNWNTASTWVCGQIPTPTLDTVIEQGHTINLPNGYQGNTKKLELKGNLTQGVGASVRVSN